MKSIPFYITLLCAALIGAVHTASAQQSETTTSSDAAKIKGWKKGVGWGWIWGKSDEVGALNAMTDASRAAALRLAKSGKVYDLGITYSRNSYKWPGHSPAEIMTFRSPEGVARQKDHDFALPSINPILTGWHSCALFINDNVATQIDGLAHITAGEDKHWYNGFTEKDWGGDFGVRKCDATTIPPVVARGVMLDIAGLKGVDALPSGYGISPGDIDAALAAQKVKLVPGDCVFVRTGTLRYWGVDGADHEKIGEHDSAGITLATAKYLIEQHGSMMIGSDTSGLEQGPAPEGSRTFVPVHNYLLVEQGVHIAEFHYLEDLARDKVYEFCYVAMVNKIAGTAAGFTMRPIAMK
jgi:kynurenine formamidase